ncbi:MAG: hypothetical protein LBD88_00195 [Candidatus Peribacteria bacterium]|jgi:hypothetical protein|nr:hypothetical protein [Candidatus Peribacteria bacterium]
MNDINNTPNKPIISDENIERLTKILDSNQSFIDGEKQESFLEYLE